VATVSGGSSSERFGFIHRYGKAFGVVNLVTRRMPGLRRFVNGGQNKLLNFWDTSGCDQIWVADVTYRKLHGIWTYLATIMDRYSRRILGWSLSYNRTTELTVTALRYALRKTRTAKCVILYTDRAVEFSGSAFKSELAKAGLEHSVNRPGHCTDNAYMESFYHSLKGELIRKAVFRGFTHLHRAARYINSFNNKVWLHSSLGYRSPIDYERMAA